MSAELFVLKFNQMVDLDAVFGIIMHIQRPDIDRKLMTLTFTSLVALRDAIEFAQDNNIQMDMSIA